MFRFSIPRRRILHVALMMCAGMLIYFLLLQGRIFNPFLATTPSRDAEAKLSGTDRSQPARRVVRQNNQEEITQRPQRGLGDRAALLVPGMAEISPEALDHVMKEEDNHPLNAAALLWSEDEILWARAREQVANQPLIAAAIAFFGRDDQERLNAATSLIHLEPENPLGYVAALNALTRLGDVAALEKLLEDFPLDKKIDLYVEDIRKGENDLLNFSGYDSLERNMLLVQDRWQSKIVNGISGLSTLYGKDISDGEKAERASIILELIEGYRVSPPELLPYGISNQLSRAEELTLRRLPAEFVLPNGKTVGQRATEISNQRIDDLGKQQRLQSRLDSLDQSAIEEYYNILLLKGHAAASMWLIGE